MTVAHVVAKVIPQLETLATEAALNEHGGLRTVHVSEMFLRTDLAGKLFIAHQAAHSAIGEIL